MFISRIRHIYRISDKVIYRTLRGGRRLEPDKPNPGLDNRLESFKAEGISVKVDDYEEFVERSESDFSNVGDVYNEHMNETLIGKYELRHRIVKEKYFKENTPNLLTWSEKEQIRHLATSEPDEWTPERIAESFPVTVPVVMKLLKFPWKPATEERIARHDASAMRNWKELKEGSLDIPKQLRDHFLKFSDRTIPPLKRQSIKIELKKEEDLGEFESIVRKCAAKEEQPITQHSGDENSLVLQNSNNDNNREDATKKKGIQKDPKRVTLDELAAKIKNRLEKGSDVDITDKIIVNTMKSEMDTKKSDNISKEIELFNEKVDQGLVEFKEKEEPPKDVMSYPERIRIPKKAYKKGATYKVNDCFYDHDGKFLYRVLGMTK